MPEVKSPTIFISYAWESEGHRAWVLQLAGDLNAAGVYVMLDRWDLKPGDDVAAFMDSSISRADYLLLVCTETFTEKADSRRGGVGYEQGIITGELLTSTTTSSKLIPILRSGPPSTALPRYLKTRLFIDFRQDEHYKSALTQLLRRVFDVPEHVRPNPGSPPDFSSTPVHPRRTSTPLKWVLVAGTGVLDEFTDVLHTTAARIGQLLGEGNFGLVTGGWPGVDDTVARSFAAAVIASGSALEDFLIQVIAQNQLPTFPAGDLILVKPGTAEWTEAIDRADAIVLIGGLGGTWTTGELALERGKPVFPLADTGGDAKKMYVHMLSKWGRWPMGNIEKRKFQCAGRSAPGVADDIIDLLHSL